MGACTGVELRKQQELEETIGIKGWQCVTMNVFKGSRIF